MTTVIRAVCVRAGVELGVSVEYAEGDGHAAVRRGNVMKRHMVRLGLSLMVAVGWGVQSLPAQEASAVVPASACSSCKSQSHPGSVQQIGEPAKHLSVRLANHHGMACVSNQDNWGGCGCFCSEMRFIFGSCRSFFGEPCQPIPPNPWLRRQ
jgi:hypothetical protein